jgi:hypothetical protein
MKLVVITGPIASGKTSVGQALAAIARERGFRAAAIDLDVIVEMLVGADWPSVRSNHWYTAHELAAASADRLGALGFDLLTIAGPFFNQALRDHIAACLQTEADISWGMLRVSLDESVVRCAGEPWRILTSDPAFVTRLYATIDFDNLPPFDFDVDTNGMTLHEVVQLVAAEVLA